jgi:hypothetical protein
VFRAFPFFAFSSLPKTHNLLCLYIFVVLLNSAQQMFLGVRTALPFLPSTIRIVEPRFPLFPAASPPFSDSQNAGKVIIVDKVQANPLNITTNGTTHAAWSAEYVRSLFLCPLLSSPSPFLPF